MDSPEGTRRKALGAEWHARFLSKLPPDVKVWLSLCNLTSISTSVWSYVEGYDEPVRSRRKFVRNVKRSLKIASAALGGASEAFLRRYDRVPDEIDRAVTSVRELLTKLQPLLNERRLGVGNPVWVLAHLEAYIQKAAGKIPPSKILSCLVRAGRAASGQASTSWDSAEVIRKNLRNFKRRKDNENFLAVLQPNLPATLFSSAGNRTAKSRETKSLR